MAGVYTFMVRATDSSIGTAVQPRWRPVQRDSSDHPDSQPADDHVRCSPAANGYGQRLLQSGALDRHAAWADPCLLAPFRHSAAGTGPVRRWGCDRHADGYRYLRVHGLGDRFQPPDGPVYRHADLHTEGDVEVRLDEHTADRRCRHIGRRRSFVFPLKRQAESERANTRRQLLMHELGARLPSRKSK